VRYKVLHYRAQYSMTGEQHLCQENNMAVTGT